MRHCLIICLALLASCGPKIIHPSPLALLDLDPCPGWQGGRPQSESDFARAAAASEAGRLCANAKLVTVKAVAQSDLSRR